MTKQETLLAFTADFAPDLIATVEKFIADPPRTKEEVGFYLSGDQSDWELTVRSAISQFSKRDNVWGFEDKYVHEMLSIWVDAGIIPKKLPKEVTFVLDPFAKNSVFADDDGSSPNANIFTVLRNAYPGAVAALETVFAEQDKALLSFELGGGDTVFFAVVTPLFATKWANTKFSDDPEMGVTSPDWKLYWNFLGYALGIPTSVKDPELPEQKWNR